MPSLFAMSKASLFITILMVISSELASAIVINEVEQNPAGEDRNNEWVELYSAEEINLDGYFLANNKGKEVNLSGRFAGYKVVMFNGFWLVNADESVILKHNSEVIDRTPSIKDDKNNDLAWSRCDAEWNLVSSTSGNANSCTSSQTQEPEPNNAISDERGDEPPLENRSTAQSPALETISAPAPQPSKKEKIVLRSSKAPSKEDKTEYAYVDVMRTRVVYAFIGFCTAIIGLIWFKKI
ncbi:MAG TPA: lamin tail domain-containing protein [Candidatus Nanoarchaeia archaeon]|nr:lamin tail domain-containing protein [Candidatus Nanoarchaeia archaeon]